MRKKNKQDPKKSGTHLKGRMADRRSEVNVELLVREADAACKGELSFQDFCGILDSSDASAGAPNQFRARAVDP